jgi:transposase-like protein
MKPEIKTRHNWVKLYTATKNAGLGCRRCGISRPTLRKWFRRYQKFGIDGLEAHSRHPHRCPGKKLTPANEKIILDL